MKDNKLSEEDIPLLSELLKSFDECNFELNDTMWFRFYPTSSHKEAGEKYAWIIPIQELRKYSALQKDIQERFIKNFLTL